MNIDKFRFFIKYYTSFFFYLAVLLGVVLFIFYPRASSSLSGIAREKAWTAYEQKLSHETSVNPQEYWQFREFYNEGNFDFNQNGLDQNLIDQRLKSMASPVDALRITPFLLYTSPYLNSVDALVTTPDLNSLLDPESIKLIQKIRTKSFVLLESNGKELLIFTLPVSEMQKANGYFQYQNKDVKKMLEGKYWLNITEIRVQ